VLGFFGDEAAARLFHAAVERLIGLGAAPCEVDFAPFREAARLLYEGPWAERLAGLEPFLDEHPEAWLPVTREIVSGGKG
jgi:hypothetical protein